MLHFLLCDDNKNTLDKIVSNVKSVFANNDIDANIVYATTSATKALKYLKSNKVDVVVLDIDLSSELSGIDIAKEIRQINKSIYIIFLTGHFEYSMIAYKVKTFDFLVKPISYSNLEETILRLCDDAYGNKELFVNIGNSKHLFKTNEIMYIEKNKAKANVHTINSIVEIYGTFDEIKTCLPEYFIRCNKSYLINAQYINYINEKNHIIHIGEESINYSPKYFVNKKGGLINGEIINRW